MAYPLIRVGQFKVYCRAIQYNSDRIESADPCNELFNPIIVWNFTGMD